ncbi:MAG: tRNA1(Val) (adenine(37)-N6)-methyltransferase [Candidatus Sumerlaeia bacterium]
MSFIEIESLPALPDLDFEKGAKGQAPGHDALLLARVVELTPGQRILDMGCGQGGIALMLAAREKVRVTGVDISKAAIQTARKNHASNASVLKGEIEWLRMDVRDLCFDARKGGFDLVVMNPPWFEEGAGRLPPDRDRAIARHELAGKLHDWFRCAAAALREGGRLCCVHIPERRNAIVGQIEQHGFCDIEVEEYGLAAEQKSKWLIVQARLVSSRERPTAS